MAGRRFLFLFATLIFICASTTLIARADITGSSALQIIMFPIPCTLISEIKLDTPCEKTFVKFDIESLIKLSLSVSGLLISLDSAIGIPGLEHVILTTNVTLGMVDLISEFWFATPYESVTDVNGMPNIVVIPPGKMLFVKKRLTTTLNLGGVEVKNLAILEDVTFPDPGLPYGEQDCNGDAIPDGTCVKGVRTNPADRYQTQSFAFGDLISLTGQTISGIGVGGQLGICATNDRNSVKKYSETGRVNPHCVGRVKPQLFFDFENVSFTGITLAPGIVTSVNVSCSYITTCQLINTYAFSDHGPLPISASLYLTDLLSASFGGVNFLVDMGSTALNINIDNTISIASASLRYAKTIISGNLTARISSSAFFKKGVGITGATIGLSITSGTMNANHSLIFIRNPVTAALDFGSLAISMGITLAPFQASIQTAFGQAGLSRVGFAVGLVY